MDSYDIHVYSDQLITGVQWSFLAFIFALNTEIFILSVFLSLARNLFLFLSDLKQYLHNHVLK